MVKRFIIAIVFVVIVCGGLVGFNFFRDHMIAQFFAHMKRPAVTVSTVVAKRTTWTPQISAIGTVSASKGVNLTVEVAGLVTQIDFKANQHVKAGTLLLQLDDAQQRADLEAEKAQAALDQQNLRRAQALRSKNVGSEQAVQQAQAAATASAAQVAKLKAVLEQKQLRAPFSGTLGIPQVDPGQYLVPGNTVATLQDLDTMHADFTVPEQDLPKLAMGEKVLFGLTDAKLDFHGRIIGIDPKVDPQTRLVSVRAEISDPNGKLTPGQFVQIRVLLPPENNIMALPQTAVVTSLYGDYVYKVVPAGETGGGEKAPAAKNEPVVSKADLHGAAEAAEEPAPQAADKDDREKAVKQAFVKIGRRSDDKIEITSGVSPGDVIVTAGQNRLAPGTPVKIDNSVKPTLGPDEGSAGK